MQVGAVIGGEFSYGLLRLVHPVGEEGLQQSLDQLTDAELLYVRGIRFSHRAPRAFGDRFPDYRKLPCAT